MPGAGYSRRRLDGLEDAAPISLGLLPPGQAAELYVRLADRPGLQPGDGAVAEVTRLCGYLPLAIRLVAARIRHHSAWTVAGQAAELAAAHDRLEAMHAEEISVAAAFDLSYQDLTPASSACSAGLACIPAPRSTPMPRRHWMAPACQPPGSA